MAKKKTKKKTPSRKKKAPTREAARARKKKKKKKATTKTKPQKSQASLDAAVFAKYLGMSFDAPEFASFLTGLGKAKVSKESIFVEHRFEQIGLSVHGSKRGTKEMQVSGFVLYSDGSEGMEEFTGALPHKLEFSDTPKTVRQKLGKPKKADLKFAFGPFERFSFSKYVLAIFYPPDLSQIAQVHISLPTK